ncbi:hypothetical protein [Bacillus anthracis]|nr:hypothetical protein [Bacillus anthracis]
MSRKRLYGHITDALELGHPQKAEYILRIETLWGEFIEAIGVV